jgi:hypothetical protein
MCAVCFVSGKPSIRFSYTQHSRPYEVTAGNGFTDSRRHGQIGVDSRASFRCAVTQRLSHLASHRSFCLDRAAPPSRNKSSFCTVSVFLQLCTS